jgi:hypothetical protein
MCFSNNNPSLLKQHFCQNWDRGFGLGLSPLQDPPMLAQGKGCGLGPGESKTHPGGHLRLPPPCTSYGWVGGDLGQNQTSNGHF